MVRTASLTPQMVAPGVPLPHLQLTRAAGLWLQGQWLEAAAGQQPAKGIGAVMAEAALAELTLGLLLLPWRAQAAVCWAGLACS